MKLTLSTYTEPLVLEVEKDGEVIKTLEFELDFCDTNVFKMTDMAKEVVNTVKDFENLKTTEDTRDRKAQVHSRVRVGQEKAPGCIASRGGEGLAGGDSRLSRRRGMGVGLNLRKILNGSPA